MGMTLEERAALEARKVEVATTLDQMAGSLPLDETSAAFYTVYNALKEEYSSIQAALLEEDIRGS